MTKREIQSRKLELGFRLAFYVVGLTAACTLALANSSFTGEAFAFIGGILGGDALSKNLDKLQ